MKVEDMKKKERTRWEKGISKRANPKKRVKNIQRKQIS